jgi:hypothetical protein
MRRDATPDELQRELKHVQKESVMKLTGNEKLLGITILFISADNLCNWIYSLNYCASNSILLSYKDTIDNA